MAETVETRVSLEEFDEYRELTEQRHRVEASQKGRRSYKETLKDLGRYPLDRDTLELIAEDKARRTEARFRQEWRNGNHRHTRGLGIGVKALISLARMEQVIETFVPDPPELGAPTVVLVDLNRNGRHAAGLTLPEGTFRVERRHHSTQDSVTLYSRARQYGPDQVETILSGTSLSLMPFHVLGISDSAGALWHPHRFERMEF